MLGTVIENRYRVEGILGRESRGALSIVYLCHDIDQKRLVALKTFPGAMTHEREFRSFKTEAGIVSALKHPNIIEIFDVGIHDKTPFIVMEYLQGESLKEILSGNALALRERVDLMRQIASGLDAVHSAGVIHRDLSSQNIMVTDTGVAKLLDFSIAKDLQMISSLSQQGTVLGSVPYLSPEQIGGGVGTPVSDVFGFGMLLYEAITGKNPFSSDHPVSMLYNIANREPVPIATLAKDITPQLAELVESCLAKKPEDRPQDMRGIVRILSELNGGADEPEPAQAEVGSGVVRPRAGSGKRNTPRFNPYLNRTMLRNREDFFGRERELRKIFSRLNASPPGSVSVVGDRRIGKSSLLNFIYMKPTRNAYLDAPDRTIVVFLDFQEETNMSVEAFCRMLIRLTELEAGEFLAPSPSGSGPQREAEYPRFSADLEGVKKLIEHLDKHGYKLIVLLDEFESVTFNANFDLEFFAFLRFLANHYNVAYITSSTRDLQQLCHTKEIADSPFFNIFTSVRLSAFSKVEAEDLIRSPSERYGKPLAPYAGKIVEIAGRFPFFLQMLCAQTIDFLEENPNLGEPDFEFVSGRFLEEASAHFRFIWNSFDRGEKTAVFLVVEGKDVPDSLKHIVQALQLRGLIEETDGRPVLSSRCFQEFIRGELEKPPSSARGRPFATGRNLKWNQFLGMNSDGWLDRAIRKRVFATVLGAFGLFGVIWLATLYGPRLFEEDTGNTESIASSDLMIETGPGSTPLGPDIRVLHPLATRGFPLHSRRSDLEVMLAVSDPDGVAGVKIDGDPAFGEDSLFTSIVSIHDGLNLISVRAEDGLGNATEITLRVQGGEEEAAAPVLRQGRDYALLFGGNDYDHWRPLTNALLDAQTIGETLARDYGFSVEIVPNGTRSEMFKVLREYQKTVFADDDQLFVFVAGHGHYDESVDVGYIVSQDSKTPDEDINRLSMISQFKFVKNVASIPCKHILLAMDVCFAGAYFRNHQSSGTRGGMYEDVPDAEFIKRKRELRTRKFLTATGITEVQDGYLDQHSPFASRLLEALRGENRVLTTSKIFTYLEALDPLPLMGGFEDDEIGSEFFFAVRGDSGQP